MVMEEKEVEVDAKAAQSAGKISSQSAQRNTQLQPEERFLFNTSTWFQIREEGFINLLDGLN